MSVLICLFYCTVVSSQSPLPETSLHEYLTGVIFNGSKLFTEVAGTDTGVLFTGRGTYDLVYREIVRDAGKSPGRNTTIDAFNGLMAMSVNRQDYGVYCSGSFGRLRGDWMDTTSEVSEHALFTHGAATAGGWWRRGPVTGSGLIDINPRFFIPAALQHRSFAQRAQLIVNSPAINFSAALQFALPSSHARLEYKNASLLTGYSTIRNNANTAFRTLQPALDEHRFGVSAAYHDKVKKLSFEGAGHILTNGWWMEQASGMPLEVSGGGCSAGGRASFERIRHHPEFSVNVEAIRFALSGFDQKGERFLSFDENQSVHIQTSLGIRPGKNNNAAVFGANTYSRTGGGSVALYPFSNWLYVLDLPDRIKLFEAELNIREAGIRGQRRWALHRNNTVDATIIVSGCKVSGLVETAKQVRYMGILPVYEDHRVTNLGNGNYLILKMAVEYRKRVTVHELYLSMRQIVPVEIKRHGNADGGIESTGGSGTIRRVYGGLSVVCGFDAGLPEKRGR